MIYNNNNNNIFFIVIFSYSHFHWKLTFLKCFYFFSFLGLSPLYPHREQAHFHEDRHVTISRFYQNSNYNRFSGVMQNLKFWYRLIGRYTNSFCNDPSFFCDQTFLCPKEGWVMIWGYWFNWKI